VQNVTEEEEGKKYGGLTMPKGASGTNTAVAFEELRKSLLKLKADVAELGASAQSKKATKEAKTSARSNDVRVKYIYILTKFNPFARLYGTFTPSHEAFTHLLFSFHLVEHDPKYRNAHSKGHIL
jgi:hypothetical protein